MLRTLFLLFAIAVLPMAAHAQTDTKTKQNKPHPNMDYKQMDAPLPAFKFMSYESKMSVNPPVERKKRRRKVVADTSTLSYSLFTEKDLDNGGNLFLIMFNPTCTHCQNVAAILRDSIHLFKKSNVLFIANSMMRPYISDFVGLLNISKTPNMYVGYDSTGVINELFLYQSLPQINIYSAQRKLLKTYAGEVTLDTLRKFID